MTTAQIEDVAGRHVGEPAPIETNAATEYEPRHRADEILVGELCGGSNA